MPRCQRKVIDRGGGRQLHLFSRSERHYTEFDGLPSLEGASPYMCRHPLLGEWVVTSAARQGRTFLPNQAECPLCPMHEGSPLTDIPVNDYEIAIFSNRFAALSPPPEAPPGLGLCEVVSYSADHDASLASIGADRMSLLIEAVAMRAEEMLALEAIDYVLPFENRGREIGVTIDHPHGQIYALSHLPEAIRRQAEAFRKGNPLATISKIDDSLVIARNEGGLAFVPPWARYPFEVWVIPFRRVARPAALTDEETDLFASLLDSAAKKLDAVFDAPMPMTMGWHLSPKGYEDVFHFHCVFQPLRRSRTKLKYLAGVEQISGLFLLDLPPEKAAAILNGRESPDD